MVEGCYTYILGLFFYFALGYIIIFIKGWNVKPCLFYILSFR